MAEGHAKDAAEEAAEAARAMCVGDDWWPARPCGDLKHTPLCIAGHQSSPTHMSRAAAAASSAAPFAWPSAEPAAP